MIRSLCLAAAAALALPAPGPADAQTVVAVAYLERQVERPPVLSNLDPVPADLGLQGARLGLEDNRTTGRYLNHDYRLAETVVAPGEDWLAAARAVLAGHGLVVVNAPAAELLALADLPEAAGALLFNAAAPDEALREEDCRANLLHTAASHAMRADALAQFLVHRRWTDWVMIAGPHPADQAMAAALRRAAARFGARLRAERAWAGGADIRRNIGAELPLYTQDLPAHQVLLVADEIGDFGPYVEFNTWEPRPVAGSAGAVPATWSDRVEAFGAAQLNLRFRRLAGRPMQAEDYGAWAAMRALGEAVTRTGSADPAAIRAYLLSPAFELAAHKGAALSFRDWNGQLRQPVPVATRTALVAMAPLPGFLHATSTLDTLGLDRPETRCRAFAAR